MNLSKITFLVIALGFSTAAFSQINLGIKIGGNYNFNGFESDSLGLSLNDEISFQAGGLVRLKIKKIHLQGEALFSSRKGEIISGSGTNSKINFYTFDIPLIIGYKLIDLKVVKVRLNAGLVPSFNVVKLGDLEKLDYKDSFYSATGGISVDVPLFLFDLRYQGAIGDYYEVQSVNHTTTLTNNLLTFSVAWKIL